MGQFVNSADNVFHHLALNSTLDNFSDSKAMVLYNKPKLRRNESKQFVLRNTKFDQSRGKHENGRIGPGNANGVVPAVA